MENPDLKFYEPTDKQKETIAKTYERFSKMVSMRSQLKKFMGDRSLSAYISDSMQRWNGYLPPTDNLSDPWQSHVFNNFTRNVVLSFLNKVAMRPPKALYKATTQKGYQDPVRAHIIEKGVEYTRNLENYELKFLYNTLEMTVKGTCIAHEGFKKNKRKVRDIVKYDSVTGEFKAEEREIFDYNDCFQTLIPLEDFYVGNIWARTVEEQPDIIWRRVIPKELFKEEYGKYSNYSYVKPGNFTISNDTLQYYRQRDLSIAPNAVEVMTWYRKQKDRMITVANGVVLYDGPFPWNHKQYPFAHSIFEPLSSDCFYGRSLPDKVASDQDVLNTFWNMGIDQQSLSIHKPILTEDPDPIHNYIGRPGLIQPVTKVDQYRVLSELTGPDSSFVEMLTLAMKFANDNSGTLMGASTLFANQGKKMTARQSQYLEEQAQLSLGLSTKMLESFEQQALKLRAKNFLQFYSNKEKMDAITGENEAHKKFIRVLHIDQTELSDGTHGSSIIRVARSKENMPTQEDIVVEEKVAELNGINLEVNVITPDYIRNIDVDVQVVGASSYNQSKALKQAMGLELYQILQANPLINQEENTREILDLYEKDKDRFMKQMTPNPEMGMTQTQGVPPQSGGTAPPISKQVMRSPTQSLKQLV